VGEIKKAIFADRLLIVIARDITCLNYFPRKSMLRMITIPAMNDPGMNASTKASLQVNEVVRRFVGDLM
jgi:hypothetical protein